ncbi:MAG: Gfo/Idh/MocA family oxidoreductase [Ignavibacteria bacterium]|nr:Gfo/Idh/MocA family oxidoreductase [Ignavibacteria bacterium]
MKRTKKIKVSVIGVGHLGSIHSRLLRQNEFAEFVGVYDIDAIKVERLSNELNCIAHPTLEDVVKNAQAVIIATSTTTHYSIARKCIENSIHCFIEKPITAKYNHALKLIEIANQKKVIIQVGHVERFNPALKAIMKYNPEPLFIESHRLSQFKPRAIDVSVVSDLMIHDIDIVLWLIKSKLKRISANGVPVLTDTIDIANARLDFENGAVANLTASRISAKPTRKMRIFQKQGYFSIDFANQNVEVYKIVDEKENVASGIPANMLGSINDSPKNIKILYETPEISETNAIIEEHNSFFKAILFGEEVPISAFEASQALKVSEMIEKKIAKSLQFFQSQR